MVLKDRLSRAILRGLLGILMFPVSARIVQEYWPDASWVACAALVMLAGFVLIIDAGMVLRESLSEKEETQAPH